MASEATAEQIRRERARKDDDSRPALRAEAEKDMQRLEDIGAGRIPEDEEGIAAFGRWFESQPPEWIAEIDALAGVTPRR